MLEIEIGQDIYCPQEGWSGTVARIERDEDGEAAVAILKDHDPGASHPWICLPLDAYTRDKSGHLHS